MAKSKKSAADRKPNSIAAVGCLLLFALPFAGVGTFMLYLTVMQLWNWAEARHWVERPATLLEAKLEVRRGDDSTTYEATARYAYSFDGRQFESEQVAFSGAADNIGSYQRRRGRELEQMHAAGGATVCYVDPDDPSRSVLYRDLRPEMIAFKGVFALVFGFVGYGMLWGGVYAGRTATKRGAAQSERPSEPWTWREDWAAGRIRSNTRAKAIAITAFAVLWNLISWPAFLGALFSGEHREWWLPLVVGIFPAVGAIMAFWAWRLWHVALRWGVSEFEMATVPGVLGGPVAGVVHGPAGLSPPDGFRLKISCVKKDREHRGSDSSTVERTLWSDERLLGRTLAAGPSETAIPVKFRVPYHLPPSDGDGNITWKLEVKAKAPGVDYDAEFEIPVFKTAASSPEEPDDDASDDALAAYELPMTKAMVADGLGARLEYDSPEETAIYFPMARNRGSAIFLGLFAVVWTGACVGLLLSDVPRLPVWGLSFLGVLIDFFAFTSIFGSNRLRFGRRGVSVHRRWLVFGKLQEIPADDVAAVTVEPSGMTYNSIVYQRVSLRTKSEQTHTLVGHVASKHSADKLAALIRAALGLPEKQTQDIPRNRPATVQMEAELPDELS